MEASTRLHDGTELQVRVIEPDDKGAIAAGFDRMSPESRYRRFFSPLNRLSDADLRYLTEVDHHDHEAVVAISPDGEPVGVARYVRGPDPSSAEVAVTVVDEWQGKGAATLLLELLVKRARAEGIERFVAVILEENEGAIELFKNLAPGDPRPRRSSTGQLELTIELPDGSVSGTMLGRALRTAASGKVVMEPWRLLKHRVREQSGDNRPDR